MTTRRKAIPEYFITPRNTILQVIFTALMAYIFINFYHPFNVGEWYDVSSSLFYLVSGLLVFAGILVIIMSRLFMFWLKKRRTVTRTYYILMITSEVFFMGVLYAVLERVVLGDVRPFSLLIYLAVQNTSLILLIPYSISLLFFAWRENKMNLDSLLRQIRSRPQFIPFRDENGILRVTIKANDVVYLEASDNYVIIYYRSGVHLNRYLLRNTLKKLEEFMKEYPFIRCHRSYMVNVGQVKMLRREKGQFKLWLDDSGDLVVPVSRSYSEEVAGFFDQFNVKDD